MGCSDHNTAMYMPLLDNSGFNTSDWCLNLYYRKMPQIIWDGILGNTIGNQEAELPVRRTQTRQALVLAARDLVLKRGHEKISIQDITIEAGLGTGTFYNYFSTKQDVFEAVLADYRQQFADEIGATRARLKDPATVVAVTLKYYFHQAQHNDQWKNFLIFSGLPDRHVLRQDDDECLADIQRGVKAGRFKVEDSDFARSLYQRYGGPHQSRNRQQAPGAVCDRQRGSLHITDVGITGPGRQSVNPKPAAADCRPP